jgi:hypothetical protein
MKNEEEIDEVYKKLYLSLDDSPHYHTWVRGYTQCQEDMATTKEFMSKETLDELFDLHDDDDFIDGVMADKKYTEEDIREAIDMARQLSHVSCLEDGENRLKYSNTEDDIINSLNKQD